MTNNEDMRQLGRKFPDVQGASQPPTYERQAYATSGSAPAGYGAPSQPPFNPGPSNPYPPPGPPMNQPGTGQVLASSLPPDHPEMQCLRSGGHLAGVTRWGLAGVLLAVFCFPIGIICCILDRRVVCSRCGSVIDSGSSC